ncbi:MAG: tripartite tricarboxylate transporter TctB family protein [Planctomycetota bacterium]|jgi:hypothetical protein|nr:tripartite tricarboxylate transporter TctB family protein [Planctomycetota bacterium]
MDDFKNKYADLITGLLLAIWGVIGFFASYYIRVAPGVGNISASMAPRICGALLFVLGLALAYQGLLRYRKAVGQQAGEMPSGARASRRRDVERIIRVAGIITVFILYLILLRPAGFLICTPVLIFATGVLLCPVDQRRFFPLTLVAVIATAALYLVFVTGFNVRLPMGVLR